MTEKLYQRFLQNLLLLFKRLQNNIRFRKYTFTNKNLIKSPPMKLQIT